MVSYLKRWRCIVRRITARSQLKAGMECEITYPGTSVSIVACQ